VYVCPLYLSTVIPFPSFPVSAAQLLLRHVYEYPIIFFVQYLTFIYSFSFFISPHPYLPLTIPAR